VSLEEKPVFYQYTLFYQYRRTATDDGPQRKSEVHEVHEEVEGVVVCEVDHPCEAVEVVLVVVDEVDSVTVEDVVVAEAVSSQEEHHEVPEVVEVVVDSEVDVEVTRFCFLGRCTICLISSDY
jgi:hypothetical protein